MHELSVASAILNTAVKHAEERPVSVVSLRVGRLRQVVPDSLRFYFEIVARDTLCEHAELRIAEIEVEPFLEDVFMRWSEVAPRAWHLGPIASGPLLVDAERLRAALDAELAR